MSPIAVALAFISGCLVVGLGVFVACAGLTGLRGQVPSQPTTFRSAGSLQPVVIGLVLAAGGIYGIVAITLH